MTTKIPSQVQTLPHKPGCYIFKNADGDILYIGKAIQLKSRVSSYWHKSGQLAPHKQLMIPQIKKVEYIITSSESEALMLESTLIKQHQPPFNIDLKDDKSFLYIKITLTEDFPRVFTVRRVQKDGARYFGPYVSSMSVRQTLHMLRKLFPHRNFDKPVTNYRTKYLIKRYPELMGPADKIEYRQTIDRIIKFLKGDFDSVIAELKKKMSDLSKRRLFEKAAQIRDTLNSIAYLTEKQKVISPKLEDMDIISLARDKQLGAINLFTVRHGKLLRKQIFTIKNVIDQTDNEAIQAFMEQFYPQVTDLPKEIVIPYKISGQKLFERTFKCKISIPERGFRRQYVAMGKENAEQYLTQQKASWEKDEAKATLALTDFKNLLHLPDLPKRIETFDISNIQGTDAVGSMVVFTNGLPDKKWYRKFKIKTVKGSNDPAMMAEMVSRRFRHIEESSSPPPGGEAGVRGWPKPDLVILDGGKGQLSVVRHKVQINIPIVALAKREEEIFMAGKPVPVRFPQNSEALFLVQRMRDEAHRFAITFFRKTHGRGLKKSLLDSIPGLGTTSRKKLIKVFESALGVRDAGERELAAVVGPKLAQTIKENI